MDRPTDNFRITAEDGTVFQVYEYTERIDAGSRDDPTATIEGLKTLLTADGLHVNYVSPGEYYIVELGLKARRA